MAFQSEIEDMNDRDDAFTFLLSEALKDPDVNNKGLGRCFDLVAGEVSLYIRTGWNEIIDHLNEEIDNDGDCKEFLLSYSSKGNKVIDVAKMILK